MFSKSIVTILVVLLALVYAIAEKRGDCAVCCNENQECIGINSKGSCCDKLKCIQYYPTGIVGRCFPA